MFKIFLNFHFVRMAVLPTCKSVHHMYAEKGIGSPGTGVTDSYELSCGCWELTLDPLEEQPELLTSEPSFQLSLLFNMRTYYP